MNTPTPNLNCDLLVIGSGAGGLSAAVTAAKLGLQVIVVEKDPQYGGTTAWSGGWMWIPRNPLAQAAGIQEPLEVPLNYLRHELGQGFDEARARTYLQYAPQMVAFFQNNTALQFIDGNAIPDFHGHTPDAGVGGRSVCAAPFDARQLGANLARLKPPLYEMTFLGMGIASGADLRHFIQSRDTLASFWYVAKRTLIHAKDLLLHRRGMRLVNGNALVAALAKSAFDAGVQIRTHCAARQLLQEGGTVTGALLETPQGPLRIHARCGVVLACGGFPHDAERKRALLPHAPTGTEHFSAASRGNTGDGLRLGESAGGSVRRDLHQAAALAPVSLVPRRDGSFAHFPHLIDRAKPGLIAVTCQGRRFGNEADSYHDFTQALIASAEPGQRPQAWLIADRRFLARYGLGAVKPTPMPHTSMLANGYLKRGQTLDELAQACGIEPRNLRETVARYNQMAREGKDLDFAKGETPYNRIQGDAADAAAQGSANPCMAPLVQAPFYAVRIEVGSLGTFAGLATNLHSQVLDASGQPIAGLYASGNDASSMMAGHYPAGGITLGPAMTFGWIAAHHAAGVALPDTPAPTPSPAATAATVAPAVAPSTVSSHQERPTMYYELATLTIHMGTTAAAAENVQAFCQEPNAQGELLGCWFSDIGTLNQLIVLRGFDSLQALQAERERTQQSASPFGCAAMLVKLEQHSYKGFPWMKPVRPSSETGITGPVYEIRTYGIKAGGLQPTIDLWQEYVPLREKISPCTIAMVALDGPLRFTNIWPYPTLDARSKARADAVAQGIWPPKGGPANLTTDMTSTIAMPTAVSPLK